MVQLPREPIVSGKRMPMSCAASCRVARITPASATASRSSALIERMRFMRRIDSSSAEPSAGGVAPAAMPVLPPCGTSGTRCSAASRTMVGDLFGRGRRQHRRRSAVDPAAPVGRPTARSRRGSVITALGPSLCPASAISCACASIGRRALGTSRQPRQSGRHGPAAHHPDRRPRAKWRDRARRRRCRGTSRPTSSASRR